jgi:lysophospholipase L1-like esterase
MSRINERLECYAAMTDRVEFFNATAIFMSPDGRLRWRYLPDGLHPGAEEARVWANAIVENVVKLLSSPYPM